MVTNTTATCDWVHGLQNGEDAGENEKAMQETMLKKASLENPPFGEVEKNRTCFLQEELLDRDYVARSGFAGKGGWTTREMG